MCVWGGGGVGAVFPSERAERGIWRRACERNKQTNELPRLGIAVYSVRNVRARAGSLAPQLRAGEAAAAGGPLRATTVAQRGLDAFVRARAGVQEAALRISSGPSSAARVMGSSPNAFIFAIRASCERSQR